MNKNLLDLWTEHLIRYRISMSTFPSVTIAIPAYNEAANIEAVVLGFLSQEYPGLVELLVADGGSTDGTQDIADIPQVDK